MARIADFEAFDKKYGFQFEEDQESVKFIDDYRAKWESEVLPAHAEKRIWTLIDHEGKCYLTAGIHYVNRLDMLISERPYESKEATRDYLY